VCLFHFAFTFLQSKTKGYSIDKIEQNRQNENKGGVKGRFVAEIFWEFFRCTF
jgi:hypothetical protein